LCEVFVIEGRFVDWKSRIERVINCAFGGMRHVATPRFRDEVPMFECRFSGHLATFDNSRLTALVIAAHRESIRVEISPCNMQLITIHMHPRTNERSASTFERHPDINRMIEIHAPEHVP
jgi:hypothetical protein